MHKIGSKWGLNQLLECYLYEGIQKSSYWIKKINKCINEGLALDNDDYENTPTPLKQYWAGLR